MVRWIILHHGAAFGPLLGYLALLVAIRSNSATDLHPLLHRRSLRTQIQLTLIAVTATWINHALGGVQKVIEQLRLRRWLRCDNIMTARGNHG